MNQFTDTFIKRLKPKDKREEKFEGGGFGIMIYPTGTKTWIYRYKIDNKKDYIILGHYPEMSLSDARKQFLEFRDKRRAGLNPKEIIKEQNEQDHSTVKKLILDWYTGYIEKQRAQPKQIKQIIDADIIPLLGEKKLEKLKTKDITQALDTIVNRGSPVHANKVLAALKQAFGYGVRRGSIQQNPADSILAKDIGGMEKPRERHLTIAEIKKLWLFLDSDLHSLSLQIKNAIKIILLTGVRTGELRLAQWAEFNFIQSLWTIPAEHSKSRIPMKIHLSQPVKQLLFELKKQNNSIYVLAGNNEDCPLSDKALPKAVIRLQERIGIPQWTPHDLRRTFATQLGETLHVDPVVIEKCLGHKMPKIMATYNKNEMLPQRKEALEMWGEYIQNIVSTEMESYHMQNFAKDVIQ
ncbi:site-specific integrase [Legionella sp. 16cNR16C]|uniref:tyrosine-type recombinase/integrase n=1 Tax=Legionella sp. 16cNR16C TaxID=2905656 RepID=UPI001E5AD11F|nr:site-specific integrase [Legionella sp. 16cNR16C]MCE3044169.1 tyrosine-type recombinase/integrase [Legionella sp. 16cNR16C]